MNRNLETTYSSSAPRFPREVARRTFWFGGCIEVNVGGKRLHNHASSYLMIGDTATVLIDTGLPSAWPILRQDLLGVLAGRALDYVFPTHPEAPHMGNIGPLLDEFPAMKIVGDLRNYHLYYPRAQDRFIDLAQGDCVDLGNRRLQIVESVIHDIPNSLWGYDPDARILFASDAFPFTHEHEAGQCAMTSEELPTEIQPSDTAVVISRAFTFARYVDTDKFLGRLHAFFAKYPVDMIAPAHGGFVTNPVRVTRIFEIGLRNARI